MGHDIIGDVHGHADALAALLRHLGYRETSGAWRHPSRTAVFVGDYIDRGPRQVETVMMVRRMVDQGSALAVMGNHELNAAAWFLPDPAHPGEHLRRHVDKNLRQHAAFLAEVEHRPDLHEELVRWFLTLPLWLDLPGLRVAHACGHPRWIDSLAQRLPEGRLTEELLSEAVTRPAAGARPDGLFAMVEAVAKGVEVALPEGLSYSDNSGGRRHEMRVRWWTNASTHREAALLIDDDGHWLPDTPVPPGSLPGPDDERAHVFGHYWMRGTPARLASRVACVDYSVAKDGNLVAYRWDGERELDDAKFAWVR